MKRKLNPAAALGLLAVLWAGPALGQQARLLEDERNTIEVVKKTKNSVVFVTNIQLVRDSFFSSEEAVSRGSGSGFVWDDVGHIVTNFHVIEDGDIFNVALPGGEQRRARLVGREPNKDIAVLKVEGSPAWFFPLPAGASRDLQVGQKVIAIGNPYGFDHTVTTGIVSALGRSMPGAGGVTIRDMIQTDASINPGNSGGPLLNLDGEVVGINSAGAGSAENIGFAIAIDAAKPTITSASENPSEPVAYLGVVTQDVTEGLSFQFALPVTQGAYVVDLATNGPAETAGIRVGDVVVSFDGKDVPDSDSLGALIRSLEPDQRVQVVVVGSDGGRRTVSVTLGVNPLPQS